jgi:hypothetical protein
MAGFLRDALVTSQAILRSMQEQTGHSHRIEAWDFPPWMVEAANGMTEVLLRILPDFSRLDYASYLVTSQAVSLGSMFDPAGTVCLIAWLVGSLGLACGVAIWKEFTG